MKKLFLSLAVCLAGSVVCGASVEDSIAKLSSQDASARKDGRTELKVAFANATAPSVSGGSIGAMEASVIASLGSDLPLAEKLYLFRVLGLYGSDASARAIYPFLGDQKAEIRDAARRALVLIPGDVALGYLESGLQKGSAQDREGYIDALATRGDASAAPIIAVYLNDRDEALAKNAASALGKLGDPSSLAPLIQLHQSASAELKFDVERAMLDVGLNAELAYQLAGNGSSSAIRAAAFEQLVELDEAKAIQVLTSVIGQPEFGGRSLFFKVALRSDSTELKGLVVKYLPEATEADQTIIVAAIGQGALSEYESQVLALMGHQSWALRMTVIDTLGDVGSDASFDALLKAFLAEPKNKTIANAVARIQAPSADAKALAEVRDGSDSNTRIANMKVLELRNTEGATDVLNQIAKQEADVKLREAAFKTLENIGNMDTIKISLDLILNNDAQARLAQRSLKRLSLNYGAPDHQWDSAYAPAIKSAKDTKTREAIVLILDGVAGKKTLNYLEQQIMDENSDVRAAALRALQRWTSVDAGDVWLKLATAENSSDADVMVAQKALVRMLKKDEWNWDAPQIKLAVKAVKKAPNAAFKEAILSAYDKPINRQKWRIKEQFKQLKDDPDVGAQVQEILSRV